MAKLDARTSSGRAAADRRLLSVFFVVLVLGGILAALGTKISGTLSLTEIPSIVTGAVEIAFFITGFPAVYYYVRKGVFPTKRLVKIFALASLVISAVLTAAVTVVYLAGWVDLGDVPSLSALGLASAVAGIYFGGFVGVFVTFLTGLVLGAGAIGVMAAFARQVTPRLLAEIVRSERKNLRERAIAWFFCIPDALDVHSLTIGPGTKAETLPWDRIKTAVAWQVVFGVVLCVYVSFNTLEAGREASSMYNMFGTLISLTAFVPLLVLPWFVFHGLDAKLKGTVKDFTLYDGIKSRVFRSYIAISTLFIFIRLTLSRVEIGAYLVGFGGYLAALAGIAFSFTFIYFNYFAEDLSSDIASEFTRLRNQ